MLYLLVRRNISRKQPSAAGHIEEGQAVPFEGSAGATAR